MHFKKVKLVGCCMVSSGVSYDGDGPYLKRHVAPLEESRRFVGPTLQGEEGVWK